MAEPAVRLLARGDLAAIAQGITAWRAGDEPALREIARWLRTTRDGAEARLQSEQMGQSLLVWLRGQPMASPGSLRCSSSAARASRCPMPS